MSIWWLLFRKFTDGSFLYLLLYVNDMLITSCDQSLIKKLETELRNEFEMKELGANFKLSSDLCPQTMEGMKCI